MDRFPCPECGEDIPLVAKHCRFCHCVVTDKHRNEFKKASARKRFPRRGDGVEAPVTAEQRGLAIAALVVACVMALSVIPAFSLFFVNEARSFVLGFIPVAGIAAALGYAGRKSAMGFAAVTLSVITMVEAGGAFGYHRWQVHNEQLARLEEEHRERARQSRENELLNARRAAAEAESRTAEAQAEEARVKAEAEASVRREQLRLDQGRSAAEATKRFGEQRKRMEQDNAAAAEREAQRIEEEKKRQEQIEAGRAAAQRGSQRKEQARIVEDLKQQLAELDRTIANYKANMPATRGLPSMSRDTLERNRQIIMENIRNIHGANPDGRNNDLLASEQAKLNKVNADLEAVNRAASIKSEKDLAERQLADYEQRRRKILQELEAEGGRLKVMQEGQAEAARAQQETEEAKAAADETKRREQERAKRAEEQRKAATFSPAGDSAPGSLYKQGIARLREAQSDHAALVPAVRLLAKAAEEFEAAGDERVVEANSCLYWARKRLTLADTEALKTDAAAVQRIEAVAKPIPAADAKALLDKAEVFAAKSQDSLLVAVRFFEVADRFPETAEGRKAMAKSLEAMAKVGSVQKPTLADTAPQTVYVLKDGHRIHAAKVVDAGDEYAIKDHTGKIQNVKKSDVAEIVKE